MGCAGSKADDTPVYKVSSKNMATETGGAMPTLSAAMKGEVMELFKSFDVDGTGKVPLNRLQTATVKAGPNEHKVLKTLAEMDFNKDGFVETSEWEMYFAAAEGSLSKEELAVILSDLKTAGRFAPPRHPTAPRASPAPPHISGARVMREAQRLTRVRCAPCVLSAAAGDDRAPL